MDANPARATDIDPGAQDLGPLAWVLDEVRKSVDAAGKAARRYAREAEIAHNGGGSLPDTLPLRQARSHLHQSAGALLMVGQLEPARLAGAMEAAAEKLLLTPSLCTDDAALRLERAGFALVEFLDAVLAVKAVSPVALFPQYREVQDIAGSDRVHPADLWPQPWHWQSPAAGEAAPLRYSADVRTRIDPLVLRTVKTGDAAAARELHEITLGLATGLHDEPTQADFWKLASSFFEALSMGLLPQDLYTKRAASRVLLQYASLAKGDPTVSERLAHDLLFFAAQAVPQPGQFAPTLTAVRSAWRLDEPAPVNYLRPQFGLFDPALMAQARKRIDAAKELWSALSGGDVTKLRNLGDAFGAVCDSLLKLYPPSAPMVQALTAAVDTTLRSARPPGPELAMEVATCVLYLEAAFEDLDPADPQLEARATQLAERLEGVRGGGQPRALDSWMEELYRRVSDRQTMGTVVGELRSNLGELEKSMDLFFRNPADKDPLRSVPSQLSQMRGVLSVLGLDHATQAVLRMRDMVEEILITEVDTERARAAGTFEKLGNNLGALGFLIDMLGYQPALAKKLFAYDAEIGELKPLMGRKTEPVSVPQPAALAVQQAVQQAVQEAGATGADVTQKLQALASQAALADQPELARSVQQASAALASHDDTQAAAALEQLAAVVSPSPAVPAPVDSGIDLAEDDLLDIFLEEAREVVQGGLAATQALESSPADLEHLTTLRRAFHTLKGSSRMVGLGEFGEAAWSLEQVLNTWLADQKPADDALRNLARESLQAFGEWADDIAANRAQAWRADAFRVAADALRTEGRHLPIALPAHGVVLDSEPPVLQAGDDPFADFAPDAPLAQDEPAEITTASFEVIEPPALAPEPAAVPAAEPAPAADAAAFDDFDMPDFGAPADAEATEFAGLPAGATASGDSADFAPTQWPEDHAPVTPPPHEMPLGDDLPLDAGATPAPAEPPLFDSPLPAEVPSAAAAPLEVAGLDFASIAEVSGNAQATDFLDVRPSPIEASAAAPITPEADEHTKVIGSLRIGIPLYNVYLNEADEWSRRLSTEISEWSMELHNPVPGTAVALAHSLAGSSATVGFKALSALARALENALQHVQLQGRGTPEQGELFNAVAEDIRRLLHQFAAGFLKEPQPGLEEALAAVCDIPVDSAPAPLMDELPLAEQVYDLHEVPPPEVLAPVEPSPAPDFGVPHEDFATSEFASEEAVPATPAAPPVAAPVTPVVAPGYVAPAAVFETPVVSVDDEDEPIDAVDMVDPDLFPIFEEEAVELLPRLGGALRQWAARPDNSSARVEVLRNLHTLKGSARLAGAMRLGEMTHRLESRIEQYGSQDVPPAAWVEALQGRFDVMEATFESLRAIDAQVQAARQDIAEHAPPATEIEAAIAARQAPDVPDEPAVTHLAPLAALPQSPSRSLAPLKPASQQAAVRVRSVLLDRLVNQAGEVMITRSRLESALGQLRGSLGDLTGNLERLREQLRDIEVQAESQMQSRLQQAKDTQQNFDPLEFDRFTRVQELTRMMAESVDDVQTVQRTLQRTVQATEDDLNAQARQTRELQRDLLRTRMVEFEGISERLYRVVRQASKESGKQVKLDITGGSIEMDRGVLDRMTPAFEHLLRNCVAHGIESPEARLASGKDVVGTILVDLRQEGNDVSVEFRDDGAGLNLVRIREKAEAQGLVQPGQDLTESDAASLIFMPGFSTAQQVSELAGRGIGMDVVRSEVNALGGRIETSTSVGQGTSFRLVLPLTTAVTQVVMLRAGQQTFGVPSNLVELVRRAEDAVLEQAYASNVYPFGEEDVRFFWAGALLQLSARSDEPHGKTAQVVVLRSAAQRVALHVDEVLGNQEVVVKNLGPQLARLPGLAGMSVLSTGAVVLIYNPVALAAVYGDRARALTASVVHALPSAGAAGGPLAGQPAVADAAPKVPLVLVVDDSITVRRVTQRLLQREGYRVALAADGLQALERLQEEKPVVMLSDIEMPRMDGFDLARNVRADAAYEGLPIIMITSRIAEKHREHAMQLGVNHYLGKPYSEEELLSLVRRYAGVEVVAA